MKERSRSLSAEFAETVNGEQVPSYTSRVRSVSRRGFFKVSGTGAGRAAARWLDRFPRTGHEPGVPLRRRERRSALASRAGQGLRVLAYGLMRQGLWAAALVLLSAPLTSAFVPRTLHSAYPPDAVGLVMKWDLAGFAHGAIPYWINPTIPAGFTPFEPTSSTDVVLARVHAAPGEVPP